MKKNYFERIQLNPPLKMKDKKKNVKLLKFDSIREVISSECNGGGFHLGKESFSVQFKFPFILFSILAIADFDVQTSLFRVSSLVKVCNQSR